jgi:hypothetical protein
MTAQTKTFVAEDDFIQFPLNVVRQSCDTYNLRLYNRILEDKSPDLFVRTSENCGVELWQTTAATATGRAPALQPCHVD